MVKSLATWLSALWIGVGIHIDWHLGRPVHDHLSFGLPYHWLLAVVTFAPLPWIVLRRWPGALTQVSALVIGLGMLFGQGIEPLGEIIVSRGEAEPFANAVRWRIFAEFVAAGLISYAAAMGFALRRRRGG